MSAQLGHADVAVTAKHYAAWCGGADYRDPLRVGPHELPADLLARVAPDVDSPHVETRAAVEVTEGVDPN